MRTTIKITLLCCICGNVYSKTVCGFDSIDAAAVWGIKSIYEKSHEKLIEYGGCIKKTNDDYCFFGTKTDNENTTVELNCLENPDVAGSFHTHVDSNNRNRVNFGDNFSGGKYSDISSAKSSMRKNENFKYAYVSTAKGEVLRYDGSETYAIYHIEQNEPTRYFEHYNSIEKNENSNQNESDDDNNPKTINTEYPAWFIIIMSIIILYEAKIIIFRR